jgi:hypothetical protein
MLQRLERPLRISLLLSTLVTAVALPQAVLLREARAQTATKQKVAVGAFDGAKSGDTRGVFIEALKADGSYEVTDAEDVKGSAKASAIAEAAKTLGVSAIITGKFARGGVKLKVLSGADGSVLDEVEIKGTGGKLKSNIQDSGVSAVAASLAAVKPEEPAPEEPTEEEASEDSEADASAEESAAPAGDGLSPLDFTAGLRPVHRSFDFHDTLADARPGDGFTQLLTYELPLGPALFIDLNWYPASHFSTGAAEWFGITGGYEKVIAIQSLHREGQPDERTLKTDSQAWYVGGRVRLPFASQQLGLSGTYGQHTFTLEGDSAQPLLPDVKYSYARVMLDGTFRFGEFLAGAHIGKRFVLGTGQMETFWFKNTKTDSLEAGAMVGYRLASMLDLVAGFDWLRYAFDFNPVEKRTYPGVAGGAVDEYLTGHIAFRFHVPGASEATAEPSE